MSATEHLMMAIKASAVSDITKICLKIDADKIINDIQRRQIPRFADAPIGSSTLGCIENLQKEANFELFNWLKDFKIQDISLLTDLQQMTMLLNEIQMIGSLSAVDFKTSFSAVYDRQVIEEELKVNNVLGRSQTTLIRFCPLLTTYLPPVDICDGISLLLYYRGKFHFHFYYHLPKSSCQRSL